MSAVLTPLLTAEEFALLPDNGMRQELFRGKVIEMPPEPFPHGLLCALFAAIFFHFGKQSKLGRAVSNDSGVITERDPDTVRGADVAFYTYERLPIDRVSRPYPDVVPNVVVEVLSPSNSSREMLAKVAEYLAAGVDAVLVVDPETEQTTIHTTNASQAIRFDETLTLPEVLPGFTLIVKDWL